TMIATIITVCAYFAVAIVLIEVGLQTETRRSHVAIKVGRSLLRNPLLLAPALGALIPIAGLTIPAPVETFLKLLGGAASPCALVALGLFLGAERKSTSRNLGATALLAGSKLILHPIVAWVLATRVFGLSPLLTHTAVLLAALPTGTGPFILAELYGREADVTSSVVLASTVVSILTVSLYLTAAG
ncbi:MAG TPA: AEC family transporter, partial [Rhodopila sp.]